jgi:hypothetical protein
LFFFGEGGRRDKKERKKQGIETLRIKKGRTFGNSPELFSQQIMSPVNTPAIVSHLKNLIIESIRTTLTSEWTG